MSSHLVFAQDGERLADRLDKIWPQIDERCLQLRSHRELGSVERDGVAQDVAEVDVEQASVAAHKNVVGMAIPDP